MSFQETVLIQFKASDNVTPTIKSLNNALDSLGRNNAFRKLKTNIDLYIKDVDLWKNKLNSLQKSNPNITANTNFKQVIQDVETLQKGFQLALKDAEKYENVLNKGIKNDNARQTVINDLKKTFDNSKELERLFNSTQQKIAPKGVLAPDKDIIKATTGGDLETVLRKKDQLAGQQDRKENLRHAKTVEDVMGEPNKPSTQQSTLDDTGKKSKKSKSEEDTKSDAKNSQTISELNKTLKLFDRLIQSVTSSLEKFNQALKGATGTGKDSKNKGGGNGGNGGGKSGGGPKDGVPSDKFMDNLNHKFDDYKQGVSSNAYKNILEERDKSIQKASVGYTSPLPSDFQANTQLANALNIGQQYNAKKSKEAERSEELQKTVVPGGHGVVSAVNEMAKANEKFSTSVKNATEETKLGETQQQKVANAVTKVTDASKRYSDVNADVGKSMGRVTTVIGNSLRSVDLSKTGVVTPSNVTGAMYDAINSHSRSFDDMKGSMATLHSGKDTLQLGQEAINKKADAQTAAQASKDLSQFNIPPNALNNIAKLKHDKEQLAKTTNISLKHNIPNVDAQVNKLKNDLKSTQDISKQPIQIKADTSSASSNVQNVAQSFGMLGSSLQMATGALTQFLSIVGSGNMMGDMLQYASLRQTNQVMLTARRGRKEAEEMYDSIQQLVIRLPGNDTFMTQILTMLGTMDKSLSTGDLNTIGNTISDYYMAAKAKGQFNNETERELRNYLMTGETRNLTNSVLASEIESLKDLDNIMDRTNALQKAMQKTGLDSIAHYNTYANKLEEFTGRFQKAFADMGDYIIMLVQPLMELFNLIDDLTHSGASILILSIIGAIMLMVSAVTVAGLGVQALVYSIEGLGAGYTLLTAIKEKGLWVGAIETAQLDEKAKAQLLDINLTKSQIATTISKTATNIKDSAINIFHATTSILKGDAEARENIIKKSGILISIQEIIVKGKVTITNIVESASRVAHMYSAMGEVSWIAFENLAEQGNSVAKALVTIRTYAEATAKSLNALATRIETSEINLNIVARIKETIATIQSTIQRGIEIIQKGIKITLTIAEIIAQEALNVAMGIGNVLLAIMTSQIGIVVVAIGLLIFGVYELGKAFGWWDSLKGVFDAIVGGIGRIWDAFMNSEPVQEIITAFQNFAYTIETLFNFIGSIGGGLWELIFGVDNGESGGAFDIVGLLLEVVGAVGNFLYQISPLKLIVDIFNAIGSAIAWVLETWNDFVDSAEMQGLIKAFQDARLIIGEAFGEISEAFGEVWDALAPIGEALSGIFDDGSTEEATNDTNILLDVLKAFASVITTIVVPAVQVLVFPLRVVAEVIRTIADAISWIIGLFSNPGEYIGNFTNTIVNEFANIPRRLIGMFLGLPGQLFGGLVDGVLNILGIHSPGYIQEAVVGEFLGIPSRILGGIGNVVGAVGNFASAIWSGFDSIFGTDISGTIDGFINRLSSSFNKLKEGDIIGAVKDFGDNFLNTLDGIFGMDISGMVGGFFNQINDNWNKLSQGDFLGALKGTSDWYNDSIKRFTGVDLNQMISTTPLGRVMGWDNSNGLMQNPQSLVTGQALTQNYNNATTHSPTIVNNNFGEGSVQADARNMSAKDVQKMFTGAFGYNKARGTQGILK